MGWLVGSVPSLVVVVVVVFCHGCGLGAQRFYSLLIVVGVVVEYSISVFFLYFIKSRGIFSLHQWVAWLPCDKEDSLSSLSFPFLHPHSLFWLCKPTHGTVFSSRLHRGLLNTSSSLAVIIFFFLLPWLQIEELPLTLKRGGHKIIAPMLFKISFISVF